MAAVTAAHADQSDSMVAATAEGHAAVNTGHLAAGLLDATEKNHQLICHTPSGLQHDLGEVGAAAAVATASTAEAHNHSGQHHRGSHSRPVKRLRWQAVPADERFKRSVRRQRSSSSVRFGSSRQAGAQRCGDAAGHGM